MSAPEVTSVEIRLFKWRYPGGKNGMWSGECSCGEYATSPLGTPVAAERPALAHAYAKHGVDVVLTVRRDDDVPNPLHYHSM